MATMIFTAFLILLLGICLFVAVNMIDNLWNVIVVRHAPFVPIPKKVTSSIVDALRINSGSTVYDLGCGDARVLTACYTRHPDASYKGIEIGLLPRILAWLRIQGVKKPHTISIRKGNFFQKDISDATHIFLYLFPHVMDDLLPKFQKECAKGTRIVSCDFGFQHMSPVEIIDLGRPSNVLGRHIYVYEL